MKLTKRQLKKIIQEEYSRLKKKGLIREMGTSSGSPMVKTWNPENMSFHEMQDSALDLLEDLLDGGPVLIPKEDSKNLYEFVVDMAEDGNEDFILFSSLIQRDAAGENDRWSMR